MVHRGQIWHLPKNPDDAPYDKDVPVFVCGVHNDWVYYTFLNVIGWHRRYDVANQPWRKAKVEQFEKKYVFSKHAIFEKAYWKKRATGDVVQILGLKDDGWSKIYVYYDLNKISLFDFWEYFEPCTKEEVLLSLAREKSATKKMEKIRKKIEDHSL